MAYKSKNKFPEDKEHELLTLIENFGSFEDLASLAEYFECDLRALIGFMNSTKAKEAKARYIPGSKEKIKKHLQQESDSAAETDAFKLETYFPDDSDGHGYQIIEPYPEGLLLEVQEHRRSIRQKRLSDEELSMDSDEYDIDMEQEE